MKIDFSAVLTDLNGKPMKVDPQPEATNATLGAVAIMALTASLEDERNLASDEKLKRYALALKINAGGEIDLSVEDVAKIRNLIGRLFSVVVVGRAFELLDPQ